MAIFKSKRSRYVQVTFFSEFKTFFINNNNNEYSRAGTKLMLGITSSFVLFIHYNEIHLLKSLRGKVIICGLT